MSAEQVTARVIDGSNSGQTRATMPLVSVVIPVRNGARRLPELLAALHGQTAPAALFEVIFVDDCSTDGTADIVRASSARLLKAPSRGGSYAARNLALPETRGRLIAFTDSDCVPASDWIERGIGEMEGTSADLVAGRIDLAVERRTLAAYIDATKFLDQRRYVQRDGFGTTANLWVRREVFERIGCFKGEIVAGGDKEFGQRATATGARIRYAPDVAVRHPARHRARELARKGFRLGVGAAQQVRYAEGELGQTRRIWLRPNAYLPRGRFKNLERLERQGVHPSRLQRAAMFWLQYLAFRVPLLAGSLVGDVFEGWRNLRSGRSYSG